MKSTRHRFPKSVFRSGFTLVELMVAIVIVAVLAALIFVGVNRVRKAVDRGLSTDNLRKLQAANALYSTDNNGRFAACWATNEDGGRQDIWDRNSEFLDNYLGPGDPLPGRNIESRARPEHLDPVAYKAKAKAYDTIKASYGMISKEGYSSAPPNTTSAYRLTELTSPSQTASFVTAVNWLILYSGRLNWNGEEGKINGPQIAYRYNNKALVAYYDGHVGQISRDDMRKLDRRGGQNNAFWKGTGGRP